MIHIIYKISVSLKVTQITLKKIKNSRKNNLRCKESFKLKKQVDCTTIEDVRNLLRL